MTIGKNTLFDFDTPMERCATASLKWDKYRDRDIIPLWVADMDFRSPPPSSKPCSNGSPTVYCGVYPCPAGIKRSSSCHA